MNKENTCVEKETNSNKKNNFTYLILFNFSSKSTSCNESISDDVLQLASNKELSFCFSPKLNNINYVKLYLETNHYNFDF
jgi:hypothetical protein